MTRRAPRNNDHTPGPNHDRVRLGVDASPFTPESLHIGARQLQVGTGWVATFAVIGYPREVGPGWLAPLLGLSRPGRRRRAHRTGRPHHRRRPAALASWPSSSPGAGMAPNTAACTTRTSKPPPKTPTTCPRGSPAAKGNCSASASTSPCTPTPNTSWPTRSPPYGRLTASLLLDARPTTYRALAGWTTTLPLGMDGIRMRRTVDTEALSAAFPFQSPDLPTPTNPADAAGGAGPVGGCCTAITSARPGWCTGTGSPPACTTTTA